MNKNLAQSYKAAAVTTASPAQVVLMLYDGALRFMHQAEVGLNETNPRVRNELVNNNLIKAQKIITELQSSLDMKVPGEFPKKMFQLYEFMNWQLQQANIEKRVEPIKIVEDLLRKIRDSWDEMLRKLQREGASATTASSADASINIPAMPAAPLKPGSLNASA